MTAPLATSATIERLRCELGRAIVGQHALVDRLLIGVLTGGHLLLEGMPGLAKTLAARSLALVLGMQFQRVQFTPDLLPADLVGTEVYNPRSGEFSIRRGPIFTHVLLADEINRAPAKVQSALLEAMQERQVTLGAETLPLPDPFLVLATQNPIEHEGTYPLPEAQLDRFLLKVLIGYPARAEERQILDRHAITAAPLILEPLLSPPTVLELRRAVDGVYLDAKIAEYILDLVRATRAATEAAGDLGTYVQYGASPRASIGLALASKAYALLQGRDYVVPHDVKSMAHDVLRHRILLTFEAEADNLSVDAVLDRLLAAVPVP